MKLVTYLKNGQSQTGVMVNDQIYRAAGLVDHLPREMNDLLGSAFKMDILRQAAKATGQNLLGKPVAHEGLLAPVPRPGSMRDGYAFRQHVASARRNRGLEMLPEYDQFPVLYMTNHRTVCGPGPIRCMPDHLKNLDFELEVAVVIGEAGSNIKAEDADKHIAGLMIMNDMSARTLQMEEMLLSLGPCKGKDFATAVGPYLVTLDELRPYEITPKFGHTGRAWELDMSCKVNGELLSGGNLADMDWTFAELIERAAYGCTLYPGDIIGSGTVGTGCLLELNGTGKLADPDYVPRWLKAGDVIEMEVSGLGKLVNTIVAADSDWSILNRKKKHHAH